MIEFAYLFIFRCLSGAQNGFGYAKNATGRTICTGLMALFIGWAFVQFQPYTTLLKWFSLGWLAFGLVGTIGVEDFFHDQFNLFLKDLHLWEIVATAGVVLAWVAAGGNLIYIFASVYPSLLIHKGFVNMGNGLDFWDHRTDDETGNTFSIPWLGIKVPRLSLKTRIGIAVISLLAVIVNATSLNYKITFQDIVPWF